MASDKESNSHQTFLESMKLKYMEVYNRLSNRYLPQSNHDTQSDLISDLIQVSVIIEDEYNIPNTIVLDDYKYILKVVYQEQDALIPTFYTRFAIEEGAWIVLLRKFIPEEIKSVMGNLISLEEQIWLQKRADPEDGIFYLLEMKKLSTEYIWGIMEWWRIEHRMSSISQSLYFFASGFINVFVDKGREIVEGSVRILRSKIDDLRHEGSDFYHTQWFNEAVEYASELSRQLEDLGDVSSYSQDLVSVLLLQGILQTEIRRKRRGFSPSKEATAVQKKILHELNWEEIDLSTRASREEFKSSITSALLLYEGKSPMEDAMGLIDLVIKHYKIAKPSRQYKDMLEKEVEKRKLGGINNPFPQELMMAKIVQDSLYVVLMKIKKDEEGENATEPLKEN